MKNVLLFYAVILFSLLYSCSDVVFTTNNDYSDENEIINLVFTETVGSDTLTKYVFLNENFIDFPKHIDIQSILKSENYSANFPDVDNSFKPLISDLADSTESRKLDTSIIKKFQLPQDVCLKI